MSEPLFGKNRSVIRTLQKQAYRKNSKGVIVANVVKYYGSNLIVPSPETELYGVVTGNLNIAVKRKTKRFPEDFMFQLTKEEFDNLIFQFGISN
jgi:hypothetical protein